MNVRFEVINLDLNRLKFNLIDADNNTVIGSLIDGQVIDQAVLGQVNLNIQATNNAPRLLFIGNWKMGKTPKKLSKPLGLALN